MKRRLNVLCEIRRGIDVSGPADGCGLNLRFTVGNGLMHMYLRQLRYYENLPFADGVDLSRRNGKDDFRMTLPGRGVGFACKGIKAVIGAVPVKLY